MSAARRRMEPWCQVLRTPELLAMVFQALSRGQITRLLRVDRTFFQEGVPFVWFDLPSLKEIFAVLLQNPLPSLDKDRVKVSLPVLRTLETVVQDRFLRYCRAIHTLSVWSDPNRAYRWRGLLQMRGSDTRPLAPNLRTLVFTRHSGQDDGDDIIRYIKFFYHPGCREIIICGPTPLQMPWLLRGHVDSLLNHLSPLTQSLTRLDLYGIDPAGGTGQYIGARLRRIITLKELGLAVDLIREPVLRACGALPCLTSLKLLGREDNHTFLANYQLDENLFPALLSLEVRGVTAVFWSQLLGLRPLIKPLRKAFFHLRARDGVSDLIETAFESLAFAVDLTHLTLDLPSGLEPFTIPRPALDNLLPLRLVHMKFLGSRVEGSKDCGFFHQGRWTTVRHLLWPDQPATWADIERLALRSALNVLHVRLAEEPSAAPVRVGYFAPPRHNTVYLCSDWRFPTARAPDIDVLARFLASCFFDVVPVMEGRILRHNHLLDTQDALWHFMLLNQISRFRQIPAREDSLTWE